MPNPTLDRALISTLVGQLLASDEQLASALPQVNLTETDLINLGTTHSDRLRTVASSEEDKLLVANAQLQQAISRIPSQAHYKIPFSHGSRTATVIGGGTIVALFAFLPLLPFIPTWARIASWTFAAIIALLFLTLLLIQSWVRSREESSAYRVEEARRTTGLAALELAAKTAAEDYERALLERGMRPLVLETMHELSEPPYSTTLSFVTARGLSEVYNPEAYEVATPAVNDVRALLDRTPGGSIGLAGQRGTGKSTLMNSFVEGRSRRTDGTRGHSVMVTAPVDYLPRDFILYLFARLCEAVIVPDPPWGRPRGSRSWRIRQYRHRDWIPVAAIAVLFLISSGFVLVASYLTDTFDTRVLLLIGGVLLVGAALAVAVQIQFSMRSRAYEEEEEMDRASRRDPIARPGVSDELATAAGNYLDLIRFQQTYTEGWSGSLKVSVGGVAEAAGGLTGENNYSRNVLSLPEIVSYFKLFVRDLSRTGAVIIGIDELDKIESPDRARAFLNDIKSVFGLDQCYFLVSISEDALGSFQRRGLPIRDAFDSALDEVVRVLPLDYPTAQKLIRSRVVGLPDPYVALAFCLSGGLPRDMIRWVRAIVLAESQGDAALSAVCRRLVRDDLVGKLASSVSTVASQSVAGSPVLIARLESLSTEPDAAGLIRQCRETLGWLCRSGARVEDRPEDGDHSGLMTASALAERAWSSGFAQHQLFVEFTAYMYFCATVLDVFCDSLDGVQFRAFVEGGASAPIVSLARARQAFGISAWIAIAQISAVRRARELEYLDDIPIGGPVSTSGV
jgi:hypothetical protein